MKTVTLGTTNITVPQNEFGALPVQRVDSETATKILQRAYEVGMCFFDTARSYSDSEEKLGNANVYRIGKESAGWGILPGMWILYAMSSGNSD